MPAFEHFLQWQITQVPYCRVGDIRSQLSARIHILEQVFDGMPDPHFVPHAQTHRRAFFGIDRVAAQVLLIQTRIDLVHLAEESNESSLRSYLQPKEMEAGLRY